MQSVFPVAWAFSVHIDFLRRTPSQEKMVLFNAKLWSIVYRSMNFNVCFV